MTNTITSVVDTYIAAWNEGDADAPPRARRRDLRPTTARYLDPLMSGAGIDGITAMIGAAQAQFPGHRFELSFGPDAHNDVVRFAWTLVGRRRAGRRAAPTSRPSPLTAACVTSRASSRLRRA